MVDVPWVGFSQAKKIGELAQVFEFNMAPHNYYSHFASFISASLCAVLPNVHILETDVDDLPLKSELVTKVPQIVNGRMKIPTGPGWGTRSTKRCFGRIRGRRPRAAGRRSNRKRLPKKRVGAFAPTLRLCVL